MNHYRNELHLEVRWEWSYPVCPPVGGLRDDRVPKKIPAYLEPGLRDWGLTRKLYLPLKPVYDHPTRPHLPPRYPYRVMKGEVKAVVHPYHPVPDELGDCFWTVSPMKYELPLVAGEVYSSHLPGVRTP